MQELRGDIWSHYDDYKWIAITTNGNVRLDGACVMGRGVALQAAQRFPDLPFRIGDRIRQAGNRVYAFSTLRIFTFPVKAVWKEKATLELIKESAQQLMRHVETLKLPHVYTVRPGCGNGGLHWEDVRPVLLPYFDERVMIVERGTP